MTTRSLAVAWAALVLSLSGCLEREERIAVSPDGKFEVLHRITGDLGDFEDGRAGFPDPAEFRVTVKDQGEGEKAMRAMTARATFASAEDVPERLGSEPCALHLTTELHTERAEDGALSHTFVRTYQARRWAPFNYPPQPALLGSLQRVVRGTATPEEEQQVIDALLRGEQRRSSRLALDALEEVAEGDPRLTEARLAVHDEVSVHSRDELGNEVVLGLLRAKQEEAKAKVQALRLQLERKIAARVSAVLGLSQDEEGPLLEALARHRRALDVTEDLGDEVFVVRLRLPGRVTSHNGDLIQDGAIVWRFEGRDLWDRDQVLIARATLQPVH